MVKKSTYGRGRETAEVDKRPTEPNPPQQPSPGGMNNTCALTITAANMTDMEIDRAIEDARQANDEIFIRDDNGKMFKKILLFFLKREKRTTLKIQK